MFRWTNEYSVNVPELDKEHQFLFEALNDFYEGLKQGVPKENLNKLVDSLVDYTQFHFRHEEEIMTAANYPGLENHKNEHRQFIEKALEFSTKFKEGKLLISLEVTGFIKDWIVNHILNEDKKYSSYITKVH